jgi:uncharacterized membrane protein YraQ (UPF0718 family)
MIAHDHRHHAKELHGERHQHFSLPQIHPDPRSFQTEAFAIFAELSVLAFALVVLSLGMLWREPEIGDLAINFVSIILEAMPFMMVGSVIGAIIEVFVPSDFVRNALAGRSKISVFFAAALGMIFPVCECAIIPIVRRLINKGVPRPAAIAFLFGAPIVNPLVAASTWLAYRGNWGMVTTRMVCGYVVAVSIALVFDAMFRDKSVFVPEHGASCEHGCACCGHDHHHHVQSSLFSKISEAVTHARDDFFSIGKFLIIGSFVAALARATIDVVAFREMFASPVLSILAMMGLAVTLNLCSQTDAFIAAGFRGIFPETAQMAFMVLGPMLDLKLILSYFTIFKGRAIWSLSLLTVAAVLIMMMVLHYGFGGVPGA